MSNRTVEVKKPQWKNNIGALAIVLAVALHVTILSILGIGCPIRWITGISCAGCGMTRAYLSLLHLDIKSAFIYHPLFWSVPFVILIFVLYKADKVSVQTANFVKYFIVFLFVIVYVVRLLNSDDIVVVANIEDGLVWKALHAVREVFV